MARGVRASGISATCLKTLASLEKNYPRIYGYNVQRCLAPAAFPRESGE